MRQHVTAAVVSHNRRALLSECLVALAAQTRPLDRVLVVDNASTDGSAEMVRADHPLVDLLALPENQGGAAGFHDALKTAHADGADWTWVMDDDTIPRPDALAELLAAAEQPDLRPRPVLLASKAVWTDDRIHPMNIPAFERRDPQRFIEGLERGLLAMRTATFASLLVHREAVDRYGLPLRHFFIWSDDIEYTGRILRRGEAGYLVPTSIVVHKTAQPHTAVTMAGDRFYYHARNTIYLLRGDAFESREKLELAFRLVETTFGYLRHNVGSPRSVVVVMRGLCDGLRRSPEALTPRRAPDRGRWLRRGRRYEGAFRGRAK